MGVPNTTRPNGAGQMRNRPRPNDDAPAAVCLDAFQDVSLPGIEGSVTPDAL